MSRSTDKRNRLIQAAKELFLEKGITQSSLSDIADRSGVPLGNVYYYFKTKEDLARAALEGRIEDLSTLCGQYDKEFSSPKDRLIASVGYFEGQKNTFTRYGCPFSSVLLSLSPKDPIAKNAAAGHKVYMDWVQNQFEQMGYDTASAKSFAVFMMSHIQGAGLVAKSLQDAKIVTQELDRLVQWVEALPEA
jgi:AcrR family transcriptional regulator